MTYTSRKIRTFEMSQRQTKPHKFTTVAALLRKATHLTNTTKNNNKVCETKHVFDALKSHG